MTTTAPKPSVYAQSGFRDRKDYLSHLAEDYGLELDTVLAIANVLGPNEDFDGLVIALEDYTEEF